MNPPPLRRNPALLERGWPWLVGGTLGAAVLCAMVMALAARPRDASGGTHLRGYTTPGLLLGVFAAAMILLALLYAARKRGREQRGRVLGGTMAAWLWLHVAASALALVTAALHAGHGLFDADFSSGKLLFGVIGLLVLSGVAWRVVYAVVPPRAAPQIGNYSQATSLDRAAQQLTEIEKIAAGKSAHFVELKAWIVAESPSPPRIMQAGAGLSPDERRDLEEVGRLAASRSRALLRARLQIHYHRVLQGWRFAHVPLALLLVPLLVFHVAGALELPARALPIGRSPIQGLGGVASSGECRECHRAIHDQWKTSMHAHAMTSPVTIAQNNQLVALELGDAPEPDPRQLCVNCHGPVGAALARQARLPLERAGVDSALLNEGVSCVVCHQFEGAPVSGGAGLSAWQRDLAPGGPYFGTLADPVGNSYHRSAPARVFETPQALCVNCHDVHYDVNGDGAIVKGEDLVLQTTESEYQEYVAEGGRLTCVSCHMPVVAGSRRVAERATIPFEQDEPAPERRTPDHSFVGVDYPLDEVARSDPHRGARAALLQGAARLDVDTGEGGVVNRLDKTLTLKVTVTNVGAGHNLPTGFAFARQMWLEVRVLDAGGAAVFSSGVLAAPTDDLCDAATLDDAGNPVLPHVRGCAGSDPQLVSFQQKLVDRIDIARDAGGRPKRNVKGELQVIQAEGAEETWLQRIRGGPVARVRPSDKQTLTTIAPNDSRTFQYRVPAPPAGATVAVRLLFRNLPPSMLRALAANQPANEQPKLGPLIGNLQIVEMASVKRAVGARGR